MVKRRLVYQIAGYDPVDAAKQHRRFVRGIPTFARNWNVTVAASELAAAAEHAPATGLPRPALRTNAPDLPEVSR